MTDVTAFNPHKEEDEGYMAAAAGLGLPENPYPRGTIRFEEWRCGWQTRHDEIQRSQRLGKTRDGCELSN